MLNKVGIKYNIIKTYSNGVRVGNIPGHKDKRKRTGTGQAWFPRSWSNKDIRHAGEHVAGLKKNRRRIRMAQRGVRRRTGTNAKCEIQ